MTNIPEAPLVGLALLEEVKNSSHLPRTQVAIRCGYYTVVTTEDGRSSSQANLLAFYNAVLAAKKAPLLAEEENEDLRLGENQAKQGLDLLAELEDFRARLESTVKPFIEIQTHLTCETTLWQSKFAGFPYLPKDFEYPRTPEGEYMYLLAQINFEEAPKLEGHPSKGILQFYLARTESYGCDFYNLTNQTGFRIIYFPNPDFDENNLTTNFDFLPTLWDLNKDVIPFYIFPSYTPHRNDCFALSFQLKSAPISDCDYRFEELIGSEIWDTLRANNYALWQEYRESFVVGHRLGGYPHFTQDDPREFITGEEPYILLLQIDSDSRALEKIYIEWGDLGVCNFWIRESALKRLDFSSVLYHWDCS